MGAGFSPEVVAAAFDVAALPPGPLRIHEQVMAAPTECPACGDEYSADCTTWLGQVCYPPSVDHPVAGHSFEVPAWCATQRRFLDEDGAE